MTAVVKIGGSLLKQPTWPERYFAFLQDQELHDVLLIVGGGDIIEALRLLDSLHQLDQTSLHWRCIDLLAASAEIAFELLQREAKRSPSFEINYVANADSLELLSEVQPNRSCTFNTTVVNISAFYNSELLKTADADASSKMPRIGWQTTSDAIAVYFAQLKQASACWLLKACVIPQGLMLEQAAQEQIVDPETLNMAKNFSNVLVKQL